jgi:hypothetical protein
MHDNSAVGLVREDAPIQLESIIVHIPPPDEAECSEIDEIPNKPASSKKMMTKQPTTSPASLSPIAPAAKKGRDMIEDCCICLESFSNDNKD